jgi:hypothetical protein
MVISTPVILTYEPEPPVLPQYVYNLKLPDATPSITETMSYTSGEMKLYDFVPLPSLTEVDNVFVVDTLVGIETPESSIM